MTVTSKCSFPLTSASLSNPNEFPPPQRRPLGTLRSRRIEALQRRPVATKLIRLGMKW
jgi:hypothetical protein